MQHPLIFVAKTQRLDPVLFIDFAVGRSDKYKVDLNLTDLKLSTVGTWHVDQLVKDFRTSLDTCNFIKEQL